MPINTEGSRLANLMLKHPIKICRGLYLYQEMLRKIQDFVIVTPLQDRGKTPTKALGTETPKL